MTWDELMRLKRECGRGDRDAVEVFPADRDIVNVANMRHLFFPPTDLPFKWKKPCLSKEEAEQAAQSLRDAGVKWKESKVAHGENVEFWTEWVSEVIPSPWEPAEHFEILAEQEKDESERLRVLATRLT